MTATPTGVNEPAIIQRADPNGPRPVDLERELHAVPNFPVPKPTSGGVGQKKVNAARGCSVKPTC